MINKRLSKEGQVLSCDYGFIICFCLSLLILVFFFRNVLFHANSIYFSNSGDGLQTYYNSIYHVLFDNSYLYQQAMNYPYKESVFFTACHPAITNSIKVFGLDAYTVGIVNLTMLFSLPVSAWFLYFIFKELKVNYLYAALGSVAIAYLSPQVARFNDHYTLAYCFAIPAIIYLAMRFYNAPDLKKSLIISVLVFFMASTHMYFFVFYGLILTWVWITYVYVKGFKNSWKVFLKHYPIQLILPLILLQVIIFLLNDYTDRTNNPVGFLDYLSNWSGVFYPFNKFYEPLFTKMGLRSIQITWEGIAYVGLGATLICVVLAFRFLINILRFKAHYFFKFTSNHFLNGLLLCAIVSLLYSFGWPFIFGNEEMVSKMGILRQIRSLGRFAWIFYYVINIALIFIINEIGNKYNRYYLKTILMSLVLTVLMYDAYSNIKHCNSQLNNNIPELYDTSNSLHQNRWVEKISSHEFQAILPFPYFHVGSENFYFPPEAGIDMTAYIVSLKTGLPIITVMGSRISLKQTFENFELLKEPTGNPPDILRKFKNKKDILLVLGKDSLKSQYEKLILRRSVFIAESEKFSLRRLSFDSLVSYYKSYAKEKINSFKERALRAKDSYQCTDSTHNYVVEEFKSGEKNMGFIAPGVLTGIPKSYFQIFNDSLKSSTNDTLFTFSFWLNNIRDDQQVKQVIAIEGYNEGKIYNVIYSTIESNIKQLNGAWALIECSFKLKSSRDKIRVVLWYPKFDSKKIDVIDDMLFKPASIDVYRLFPKFMVINNCVYYYD